MPSQARLLGVYPHRPDGLFMQRVKAPAGRLTLDQWQGLAELAARYTPEYPLHVTTRQNLELHGLRADDVPAVQQGIDSLGPDRSGRLRRQRAQYHRLSPQRLLSGHVGRRRVGPRHSGGRGIAALAREPAAKVQDQRFRLPRGVRPTLDQRRGAGGQPGRHFPRHPGRLAWAQSRVWECWSTTRCRSTTCCRWSWPCFGCSMRKATAPTAPAHGCAISGNVSARRLFGVAWRSFSKRKSGRVIGPRPRCGAWKRRCRCASGSACPWATSPPTWSWSWSRQPGLPGGEVRLGLCHDLLIFAESTLA